MANTVEIVNDAGSYSWSLSAFLNSSGGLAGDLSNEREFLDNPDGIEQSESDRAAAMKHIEIGEALEDAARKFLSALDDYNKSLAEREERIG